MNSLGWQTYEEYVLFPTCFSLSFIISACLSFCFQSHIYFHFHSFFSAFPDPALAHSYAFCVNVYHVYTCVCQESGGNVTHRFPVHTRLEGSVIANLTFSLLV